MKVFRKDIQKILLAYESEKSIISKIFKSDDPDEIKELMQFFQTLPETPDYPLNEVELFQLCKILFIPVHDLKQTAEAIFQLRTHLGESFNCLESLNQNGLYNWHYFGMVMNWKGDLNKLKQCLSNKVFCETMELLTRTGMMTKPVLDWLMTLSHELDELYYVLTALDKHKVLNETFLPIFVSQNAAKDYDYTIVYKRLIFSIGRSIAAVEFKTFSEFVQRLNSASLKKKFDEFNQAIAIYKASGLKLSYAGTDEASADDVREFFTTLFMNGILTIERFNSLLSIPQVIPYIDEYLRIETDSFTGTEEKLKLKDKLAHLHKHFDAFLDFIRERLRTSDKWRTHIKNIWQWDYSYSDFLKNPVDNRPVNPPKPPVEVEPVRETSTSTSETQAGYRSVLPVVVEQRPESIPLKNKLPNEIFSECLHLLTLAKLNTQPILDWLKSLSQEELTALHKILSALNHHKVLDETFFPIFFHYNKRDGYICDLTWRSGYLNYLIDPSVSSSDEEIYQKTFGELVQKISSPTLQEKFTLFSDMIKLYMKNHYQKLSYAGCGDARTDDINRFFTTLIVKGILTKDRFNYILPRLDLIRHIDNLLRVMKYHFKSEKDEATFRLHFDVLILLSREPALRDYISEDKLKGYLEVTRAHSDSFIKIYTPFLLKLKDPSPFIWAFKTLIEKKLLSEDIFDVICSDIEYCKYKHHINPRLLKEIAAHKSEQEFNALCDQVDPDRPKSKLNSILKLHELGVTLDKYKLAIMKNMGSVQLYDLIQNKTREQVEAYFDEEKLCEGTNITFALKHDRTSYFFLLPVDILQKIPLYRGNYAHDETPALAITKKAWGTLLTESTGETTCNSLIQAPEISAPMPEAQQPDHRPTLPVAVVPRLQ